MKKESSGKLDSSGAIYEVDWFCKQKMENLKTFFKTKFLFSPYIDGQCIYTFRNIDQFFYFL